MIKSSISDQGKYFNYAVLATKVSLVLRNIKAGERLDEKQNNVLKRGAELILKIKDGAAISEGTFQEGLTHTQENISAYGYALSALDELAIEIENTYTSFFRSLYDELEINLKNRSSSKKVKTTEKINLLINFFSVLGSYFRREIQHDKYWGSDYRIISLERKHLNDINQKAAY